MIIIVACPRCRQPCDYSPALLGTGATAIHCPRCRIFGVEGDPARRWFEGANGTVLAALRNRAEEIERSEALNRAVWACINSDGDDPRWGRRWS
jgi:hypothetical protein